ncbi:Helicase PriA essential for oriC/DnaA-independent DNA replication [hydrothermal vent metagenome]|uniref:DNA 3'-5' helicase n=1 Tax=hydrothermal vent metagenome TaxID=652676 RepID=A0A3B0XF01_9ZZZZ
MSYTYPHIAQVAVPVPLYGLFDYLIPAELANLLHQGCRVRVPFGRKQRVGMVVSVSGESSYPENRLKPISEQLDTQPVLGGDIFKLLEWAASYYHHPQGEVIFSALPKLLRQGEPAELKCEKCWVLTAQGRAFDADQLGRAVKQVALLKYMQNSAHTALYAEHFNKDWAHWRVPLQSLVEKSLLQTEERAAADVDLRVTDKIKPLQLNQQQTDAVQAVKQALGRYQAFLLQGITGSGKTEVYLDIIDQVLANGLQVLVLVPEISLTPQLTQRFEARLSANIASLHSALNDTQRHSAWVQASKGIARVVIGTRSALFTPMPELGLIIIDEEHDGSFKQQEGFRYHARDLALVRARNRQVPVLLGSATPAFESLKNVRDGQYQLLKLTVRGSSVARPPRVSLLDVCRRPMDDGISLKLLEKISAHLKNRGQVLLFLNRRGYAPLLMCHECGWTTACQRCDANMTLHHHNQRLRCHHCGYEKKAPDQCPQCQQETLVIPGAGTERIEKALTEKFPEVNISRIDRDTTRRKGELDKKLAQARSGEMEILIGTQMLAKGHDFPNVTLVGILDADQGLFSADFRGTEYMAQLIVQVSGRAGRGEKPGEVIIQTHHPEHPLLHILLQSGYNGFAKEAIKERKLARFPPYTYMAILRSSAMVKEQGQRFLDECRAACQFADIQLFGPLPAPMERRAGRFRWQLIIVANERKTLHGALRHWVPEIAKLKSANRVRWSIDVDPQEMF